MWVNPLLRKPDDPFDPIIQSFPRYEIEALTQHWIAGGNLESLYSGWIEYLHSDVIGVGAAGRIVRFESTHQRTGRR